MKPLSLVLATGILATAFMAPPATASSLQDAIGAERAALRAENAARKVVEKAERLEERAERRGTRGAIRAAERARAAAEIVVANADAAAERAAQLKSELFGSAPEDHFGGPPGSYPNGRGWQAVKSDFEEVDAALATIDEKVDILDGKIDVLDEKVDTLDDKVDTLDEKTEDIQSSIDDVAGAVADLGAALVTLVGKVDAVQSTVNAIAADLTMAKNQIADVQASLDTRVDVEVETSAADAVEGNVADVQALVRVEQMSQGVALLGAAAFVADSSQVVPAGCSSMSVADAVPLGPPGSYDLRLVPSAGVPWCAGTYIMTLVVDVGTGLGGAALVKVVIPPAGP